MYKPFIQKIITCLFCLVTTYSIAQPIGFRWAKGIGGTQTDGANKLCTDVMGNVYTIGTFKGVVDFDPSAGISSLTASGNQDAFVMKTDSNGNFIWVKKIGGPYDDYANSIFCTPTGALYITGFFSGTVDFNPGTAVYPLASSGVADIDIYALKLDTAGNFVWAKQMGGSQNDYGYSIVMDANQQLVLTGSFRGTADFDPGTGIYSLLSAGNYDIFVEKLDTLGNFIWAKAMGGTGIDYGFSLSTDTFGNVYTTGSFSGTADFDPSINNYPLTVNGSTSDQDIFISKLDPAGNFVWAKSVGGLNYDEGNTIAVRGAAVCVTGYFWGTVDFNPGAGLYNLTALSADDVFTLALDTSGNFQWANRYGSTSFNGGTAIAIDNAGSVYTSGTFYGTVDFDPGAGSFLLSSAGNTDVFITKVDNSGHFVWAKRMGGTGGDNGSVYLESNGNLYTCGSFTNSGDFDPGAGTFTLSSNGADDIFIQKMGTCINSSSALASTACDSYTLNGITYTAAGVYTQGFTNSTGCDSSVILQLNLHFSDSVFLTPTACDSLVMNAQTYTASGNYIQNYVNQFNCDSTLHLQVTIHASTNHSISQTACDSYTLNAQTYTASGNYFQTLSNAVGCDSLLQIILQINSSSSVSLAQTACDSYTLNTQTYTNSGVFTQLYTNAAGCDSTIILQLQINHADASLTQSANVLSAVIGGATYQWLLCPGLTPIVGATNATFTATANGNYALMLTQNGCADTSTCYTVSGLNTQAINESPQIQILPNPSTGLYFIQNPDNTSLPEWEIYSVLGECIQQGNGSVSVIDLRSYRNGIYYFTWKNNRSAHPIKLIKQE